MSDEHNSNLGDEEVKSSDTQNNKGKEIVDKYKKAVSQYVKGLPKKVKLIAGLAILVVLIIIVVSIKNKISGNTAIVDSIWGEEGKVTTITETTIKEVLEISELQTAEYIYNSVVTVYTDDNKNIKYYVAYEGTVHAGIDFSQIQVSVDENSKVITVIVPDVYIQDTIVKTESLDFIFTKDKYDTSTVHSEAYKICTADLEEKANADTQLLKHAEENVRSIVEALLKPWINEVANEYTVIIK